MVEIIPSILTNNVTEARDLISKYDGVVRRVQIDIVDGLFANNKTIDPTALNGMDVNLGLDFHLMVKNPINWIEKCINAGADRIVGQIEMMESQVKFVNQVQYSNLRVGLAIDLNTPVNSVDLSLFPLLDVVLVMSVKAGFGGQEFQGSALEKVRELSEIRINQKCAYRICMDGGESEEFIDDSVFDGADEIVIGRSLFRGDIQDNIKRLEKVSHILKPNY